MDSLDIVFYIIYIYINIYIYIYIYTYPYTPKDFLIFPFIFGNLLFSMAFGPFSMVPEVDPTQLDVYNPNLQSDVRGNRQNFER